uniref:Microsomal glutathione S-transferase 3 n=1 Tax=Magallana gigas TaxID=29159 RepID=A0A8W8J6A6_MAGGI
MDATPIGLNADFGYVILVTISAIIMSWKVGYQVVSARKKFNVQYPKMYSEDDRFNCYQRAHQNTIFNNLNGSLIHNNFERVGFYINLGSLCSSVKERILR